MLPKLFSTYAYSHYPKFIELLSAYACSLKFWAVSIVMSEDSALLCLALKVMLSRTAYL